MFYNKYLSDAYLTIFYDTYEESYLKSIKEEDFIEIYNLLKNKGFYFLEEIILNYLEIFTLDKDYLLQALEDLEEELGSDYITKIGKDMTILDDVINKYLEYEN